MSGISGYVVFMRCSGILHLSPVATCHSLALSCGYGRTHYWLQSKLEFTGPKDEK